MEQAVEITELNRRFGIPQIVNIVAGHGGLTKVEVTSRAAQGESKATVTQRNGGRPIFAQFTASHSVPN